MPRGDTVPSNNFSWERGKWGRVEGDWDYGNVAMYRVVEASDYQVITGVGIDDLKLAKKAWILLGQSCTIFDIFFINYSQSSPSPSPRSLPSGHALMTCPTSTKYAKLLYRHDKLSNHVKKLV
ncbi:hypothetical protein ACFX2I_022952 [Malus domestica]|uniref:Uncharacterized protein n=1 Tax=Malus domestica TaxID=3750 RepID=A0A498HJN1_MALDO|nr:hypothetical protein DVH24_015741 [Malus domestica]